MKKIVFIFCLTITISLYSQTKSKKGFELKGNIEGMNGGYLFLSYQNQKDSCLITNNDFSFKGIVSSPTLANFSFKSKASVMKQDFYLENESIQLELSFEEKNLKNYTVIFFEAKNIRGTLISRLQKDYDDFTSKNKSAKNSNDLLYKKVNEIITAYPKNIYCGNLLSSLTWDETLDKNKLKQIYKRLNKKYLDESIIRIIESNLYPEAFIKVNDLISNFILHDINNTPFNTSILKGKWFLIDFWASWCAPCRKSFPDLKDVYVKFKNINFEILGVSIDKDKNKWINALNTDELEWINVIVLKINFKTFVLFC